MKEFFGFGNDLDDPAVRSRHQIAAAEDFAAWQHEADFFAGNEARAQPAFLPRFEWQPQLTAHFELVRGARNLELGADLEHQKRKYLCAMGRVFAGSQTSNSPSARTS